MPVFTTTDGTDIYYKDWGTGQPIVFSHGWPLSADDWDAQMIFFLHHGYRVIAHDRRGHGRSAQPGTGNNMNQWADDFAELIEHLNLHDAVIAGHSTGGGEIARYLGRHGESRVAKAALISAVTPFIRQTEDNPGGVPLAVFESFKTAMAANRSAFFREVPSGPFYGFNRPGAKPDEAVIANWWRQGMAGSAQAHIDCVDVWINEDYTEDLRKLTIPVLVMHSEDNQVVPYATGGPRAAEVLKNGTLKTYSNFPHGMPTTQAATINADLLAFIQS